MFCANIVKGHWSLHRTQNHFQIYAAEFAINQRTPHDPRRSLLLYVLHLNFGHLSNNLHRGHQKTDCINSVWKVTVDRPATYWTTPMVLSADLSNHLSCLNSFNKKSTVLKMPREPLHEEPGSQMGRRFLDGWHLLLPLLIRLGVGSSEHVIESRYTCLTCFDILWI